MTFTATGSQTVGPFFHVGLSGLFRAYLGQPGSTGERLTVRGRVIDGDGIGVPDALIELWDADTGGFGRVPTGDDGTFAFTTSKPGPVPGPGGGPQAPHLNVMIFMRGLLRHLMTRMYFAGDPSNDGDPVLQLVDSVRRGTLMARRVGETDHLEWDIVLQGRDETVFFDC